MKEKIYFHNISRTLVSFCIFVLISKLSGYLICSVSSFRGAAADILQFIFSAACAILAFLFFESLIPSPAEGHTEKSVMNGRFRKRPFSMRRYILETIPYTIAVTALLIVIMYLVSVTFELESSTIINTGYQNMAMLEFLSMVIIHPVVEEYIFRGMYYGELRSMSPIFACLMQAVMFAIAHNGVGGMMYALIAGILLGTAAERSNGITVPTAAHMIINLRTFLYSGAIPPHIQLGIDIVIIIAGVLSAAVLLIVYKKLPSCQKAEKPSGEEREEANFED